MIRLATVFSGIGAIEQAFKIDKKNTSSDYDYLRYKYKSVEVLIRGIMNSYKVTYHFQYNESAKQTAKVDKRIDEIFKELNIDNKKDNQKIKAIHDFIITNASYDMDLHHNTAYANLILQKSVCQGYAALTSKMMTQAGIPCRIITGMGKNTTHAWNIVKLDGHWYNIDCTWDDPVGQNGRSYLEYNYFLKSEKEFNDHERDE